ncbi:Nitroreductase [Violaceomyces palustris]|uniref:Nitroreductase n=1 Tax=Violaceomyces palustris TaxID=1673888 RepID=A0ACD0NVT4_9BASI|nr:Nitroreductase [Violaceomyces palustris]
MSTSSSFLAALSSRRTYYSLSKKPILSDAKVTELVQEAVKHSPSSFNSQSSRVVILLGKEHDDYWNEIVPQELKKVASPDKLQTGLDRVKTFQPGYGTILFFEDEKVIDEFREKVPSFSDRFTTWSLHSTGMAQLSVWIALETEGYGANLQHYGNLSQEAIKLKYDLPKSWSLQAELVFGHIEAPPKQKGFVPDGERVKVFGSDS